MGNPVLVEVVRGALVESRHRGAVAVADPDGRTVFSIGDTERPVYPRSAIKALQALPLVESGAADRFGLAPEELALACASHGGEPDHVAAAMRMLARAGIEPSALRCGAHWPLHQPSAQALARSGGTAGALHNNCSGKHAGFLCTACALGADIASYTEPVHPVQREVKAVLEELGGVTLADGTCAVDGCSVPTWAMPLTALARAFARFGAGAQMSQERAKSAARLRAVCAAHPWHVAGTGRFCTAIMRAFGGRVFVKTGAEGVFCGALPELGLGIAVKCDDGAGRAGEATMAGVLARFLTDDRATLEPYVRPVLRNWNGIAVGAICPTAALLERGGS
ncbi:MAG: asparaginase [Alphaproteobacteria bacterium]|nr:asparaginase [Alphaproteobacteria bacterium]